MTVNMTIAVASISFAMAVALSSYFEYLTTSKWRELHNEIYSSAVETVIRECREEIVKLVASRLYVSVQVMRDGDLPDKS